MTLKDILQQALKECSSTQGNRECDCSKARENIQNIIIDTEHVLFEIRIVNK